jgi:hypothetical protein
MRLSIIALKQNDTQHFDNQHNITYGRYAECLASYCYTDGNDGECHSIESRYSECCIVECSST